MKHAEISAHKLPIPPSLYSQAFADVLKPSVLFSNTDLKTVIIKMAQSED